MDFFANLLVANITLSLASLTCGYMKWSLGFFFRKTTQMLFQLFLQLNVGVICKNLHQDIHCKLLRKIFCKNWISWLSWSCTIKNIVYWHMVKLLWQEEMIKVCSSKPVKVVKNSSTFLPSCCLLAPFVTVFLCLLKTQSGKLRQQTFV